MSDKCSGCSSAGGCPSGGCGSSSMGDELQFKSLNEKSKIKKTIAIISGKGGVGKSLVTSLLASSATRQDERSAIIDADILGPSIGKMFNLKGPLEADEFGNYPNVTGSGIQVVSSNFLLKNETDPIVWRGSLVSGIVEQFWTDMIWTDVDFMFIDTPPGTGDVSLTIFQSIPLDGIVIVTSPQELVSMIVQKTINMAKMMNVRVLGIIENMSYLEINDKEKMYPFGKSNIEEIAKENGLKVLGKIKIDPQIANLADKGKIEEYRSEEIDNVFLEIKKHLNDGII